VRFVWENAHSFSLAHDVSDGGVELALAEAASWSGRDFVLSQHKEGEGVVVATTDRPAWDDLVELGTVA
jgi:phosphoribosylformylglycinamidine (FGAM) synthase-like enzyme